MANERGHLVWLTDAADPTAGKWLGVAGDNGDDLAPDQPPPTVEDYADHADENAEQDNYHELVGTHRTLAVLLCRVVGREIATGVMREIAERGGLARIGPADVGVADCWEPWTASGAEGPGRP
jgi:hypothetical protein